MKRVVRLILIIFMLPSVPFAAICFVITVLEAWSRSDKSLKDTWNEGCTNIFDGRFKISEKRRAVTSGEEQKEDQHEH